MSTLQIPSKDWRILYSSESVPKKPTATPEGFKFKFPKKPGHVNYIVAAYKNPIYLLELHLNAFLRLKIRVSGDIDAEFDHKTESFNTCNSPSSVRPILMRGMYGEFNRWWSKDAVTLKHGEQVVDFPLLPKSWSSVFGKDGSANERAMMGFSKAMREPLNIGMTFGGGCFAGHGVRTSKGSALFEFLGFEVIKEKIEYPKINIL